MPGRNCAVFGCGSCRPTKGTGIWKLPSAVDETGSGKMVALEQHHDQQVLSDRTEIIIEPSYSCNVHFVRYQEAFHALHICVTSRVHV